MEKGKDKKKRRIICRRDSANQFPIKFPRTRPKHASQPGIRAKAVSFVTIAIGNSRDRRVNHRNEDPPLISIGLLLLALPIRVHAYSTYIYIYILVKEVFGHGVFRIS